jgi:hypothetical protein
MTVKTVTSVQLKDIKAVEFECGTCHTKVSYSIDRFQTPVATCNVCQPQKQFMVYGSTEYAEWVKFGELVRRFAKTDDNIFTVRFELADASREEV